MKVRLSVRHKPTEEEIRRETLARRAVGLRSQVSHWLLAMERDHNLRNASQRAFSVTYCTGPGHWNHVRRLPPPPERSTRVECVAPRDKFPDAVLLQYVIQPLREAGFTVEGPIFHDCGCATFTARPRKLAGQ